MSKVSEGVIFALGNPLLDISAEVTMDFMKKYDLKENNAILATDNLELYEPMYKEMISDFNVQYIPGGATLNSIRYCQWLLGKDSKKACTFVGCVGTDEYAQKLTDLCTADGVNVQFMKTTKASTGTCAVCITGHNRSLVAYLAAADLYNKDEHLKSASIWPYVEKACIFYNAGFPLTVTPDGLLAIAEYASANDKIYCANLSAPFICQFFKEPLMKLIPFTDYLFGNESEFAIFAEHNGGPTSGDMKEIAKWASSLPKSNKKRERIVIITQGLDPVLAAKSGQIILEEAVEILDKAKVVDTNSAGDSFVGGFLASLASGKDLSHCIKLGQAAAKYCIQMPGSTFNSGDDVKIKAEAGF